MTGRGSLKRQENPLKILRKKRKKRVSKLGGQTGNLYRSQVKRKLVDDILNGSFKKKEKERNGFWWFIERDGGNSRWVVVFEEFFKEKIGKED